VPVRAFIAKRDTILRLETFVYRPRGHGPFPIVVLSHGSAAGRPKESWPAPALAKYFSDRGYLVVVPMRRGRGRSEGLSREAEARNCDPSSWNDGLADAYEDLTAAIDFARRRPDVDSNHVLLVGVSRGGFLSVGYTARGARRAAVRGVINFVGAWVGQRQDQCPRDFNAISFAEFGRDSKTPMLWLYGDSDPYNTTTDIKAYARAFEQGGGRIRFALFDHVPGNGHLLADHAELWSATVDTFLVARKEH
jgi:dienelactone hydrolase